MMRVGRSDPLRVPLPKAPASLLPQQYRTSSVARAHLCLPPPDTAVTFVRVTRTGLVEHGLNASTWKHLSGATAPRVSPSPQQYNSPPVVIPQVEVNPASMLRNFRSPPTG